MHRLLIRPFFLCSFLVFSVFSGMDPASADVKDDRQAFELLLKNTREETKSSAKSGDEKVAVIRDFQKMVRSMSERYFGNTESPESQEFFSQISLYESALNAVRPESFKLKSCVQTRDRLLAGFSPKRKQVEELPEEAAYILDRLDEVCSRPPQESMKRSR